MRKVGGPYHWTTIGISTWTYRSSPTARKTPCLDGPLISSARRPPSNTWTPSLRLHGAKRHAARIELFSVGFLLRAREDIDLLAPPDVREARLVQRPLPLCFQQSTGDSAGPEIDVVLCVLGDFFVDDDVRDLEPPAGLQHAADLPHHRHFVRTEVDDAVADHDIDRPALYG